MPGGFDTVLVVDFGAQYAQLIARRVRECHVYSEIVPATMPAEQMLARHPKAIILSGGPSSVYADAAPPAPPGLLNAGIPILGICYGFQLLVAELGGTVERTGMAEYGATTLETLLARGDAPRPPRKGMARGDDPPRPPRKGMARGDAPPSPPASRAAACSPAPPGSSRCGCRTAIPARRPRRASGSPRGPPPPRWPRWRTRTAACSACSSTRR